MVGEIVRIKDGKMSTVEVFYMSKNKSITEEVKNSLFWYDSKKHEMHTFSASRIGFEYKYDDELNEYRMMPKPIYDKATKTVSNVDKDSVDEWFRVYSNYSDSEAVEMSRDENGVIFSVNQDELSDFVYDLERHLFRFFLMG